MRYSRPSSSTVQCSVVSAFLECLMAAQALLNRSQHPNEEKIREALSATFAVAADIIGLLQLSARSRKPAVAANVPAQMPAKSSDSVGFLRSSRRVAPDKTCRRRSAPMCRASAALSA